jgi:hypothetical protein
MLFVALYVEMCTDEVVLVGESTLNVAEGELIPPTKRFAPPVEVVKVDDDVATPAVVEPKAT